ncbi:pyrroline-5-carboxylate reductase dimerization domain-containing protein [Halomonas ramblicola]|uniref:pyrroline-5-carboxylate reductase dimerization domain-containing protein n=1 Tax=Halomonas ramblicola TaxID=747349 RepID=UPI0025B41697|nr:pyrroline-5-carboxylate reductase dimerization domain-containing protein [Halomonas ramblicola]MDN3520085.1 pyrroline-5-carboxylate reductase dimerization domain-containing protein [Halomonas ramblicola]
MATQAMTVGCRATHSTHHEDTSMTPGIVFVRAIQHFEEADLRRIVDDAMQACAARAREMAKDFGDR